MKIIDLFKLYISNSEMGIAQQNELTIILIIIAISLNILLFISGVAFDILKININCRAETTKTRSSKRDELVNDIFNEINDIYIDYFEGSSLDKVKECRKKIFKSKLYTTKDIDSCFNSLLDIITENTLFGRTSERDIRYKSEIQTLKRIF